MIFERVNGELKSSDPKEVAQTIFDFFMWQYEDSVRNEISARCDIEAAKAANAAASCEYEKENLGPGMGPRLPYNTSDLFSKTTEANRAKKQLKEAKLLLNFIRDRFIDKFIV